MTLTLKVNSLLTHKAPITTAADKKIWDIFPNLIIIRYDIS